MKGNYDYEANILLKHDEEPAKINLRTGEVTTIYNKTPLKKKVKIADDMIKFEKDGVFAKSYNISWLYLKKELTVLEYSAAHNLALEAKAFTNSLEPINDNTILEHLQVILNVSINKVKGVLSTLFDYGVYGKFEIADSKKRHTKFWVLNPYLNFNGQMIDRNIVSLFDNTKIAQAYRGEI